MIPEHLSWTREECFTRCGQQYVYRYLEELKRPPGVALIRGKGPHKSVEADLKAKLTTGELLETEAVEQVALDYVDGQFKGEVLIDGDYEGMSVKEARTTCRDEVRKMAGLHHEEIAPTIVPTGIEVGVRAQFPELPVPYEGVIDVIDRDSRPRDTKTKRQAPEKNLAHTSEQLTVYWGLFCAEKKFAPADLSLDVLWVTKGGKRDQKSLVTTRNEAAWQVKLRRSQLILRAMEKEIFLPAPVDHWACSPRYCGFTDICPLFRGRPRATS